jgi:hypothetical protein
MYSDRGLSLETPTKGANTINTRNRKPICCQRGSIVPVNFVSISVVFPCTSDYTIDTRDRRLRCCQQGPQSWYLHRWKMCWHLSSTPRLNGSYSHLWMLKTDNSPTRASISFVAPIRIVYVFVSTECSYH